MGGARAYTLMEAAYLNVPILTSNCPNGPNEIIRNSFNGLKYELGNDDRFFKKNLISMSNLNQN